MRAITIILLLMTIVSCGIFRKNREVHREKLEREVLDLERNQKDLQTRSDNVYRKILDVTVRTYGNKKEGGMSSENAKEYEDLHEDILQEIILHSEETGKSSSGETDKSILEKSAQTSENINTKDGKLDKDSNTTWSANVPWYGWVIGGLVIVAAVWLALRQFKLF